MFKNYRNNVIERFGEEIDKELRFGLQEGTIEETSTDDEGKTKKSKKKVKTIDGEKDLNDYSDYARFFDASSQHWEKDSEYNLMFLNATQMAMNDRLKAVGHLFLNEVYDELDIPRTKAGQVVGWIWDPNDNENGDNRVDFGIHDLYRSSNRDFVNGYENVILLDFNVDGEILNKI